VAAPGGDSAIVAGDIIMIANCEQAAVVRVTGVNPSGDEATLQLAIGTGEPLFQNAPSVLSPIGMVPFTLSLLGRSYGEDALVGTIDSSFFFIAPGLGEDNAGQPPLALWQKSGTDAPVELVQGVEDLQVLFGIDTTTNDGIANANRYVTAANVPDPSQIVSARVSITANSVDAVDNGNLMRRTFSKTFQLRNANPEL